MSTFQIIQNNALRTILKKPLITRTRVQDLHKTVKVEMLKNRFETLNINYVQKVINSMNPIIIELIDDYKKV